MKNRPASNGVKNELGGYEFQSTLMMSERHFHYAIVEWEKVGTFSFKKKNKWLGIVFAFFFFFYSLATDARLFRYWALPVKLLGLWYSREMDQREVHFLGRELLYCDISSRAESWVSITSCVKYSEYPVINQSVISTGCQEGMNSSQIAHTNTFSLFHFIHLSIHSSR